MLETYGNAPVHAQIIDQSLGASLLGGTLIGDAVPDTNFERISISFRYVRDPNRSGVAASIAARALSLDGTLGVVAQKKEGYFTRSVIGAVDPATQDIRAKADSMDFKHVIAKALTAGLLQEFGNSATVEKNKAHVLALRPSTIFYAELTDFFPGGSQ